MHARDGDEVTDRGDVLELVMENSYEPGIEYDNRSSEYF